MDPRICHSCRRLNPPLAAYCYFDGVALANGTHAPRAFGSEAFPTPFVFPSGHSCRSFEELVHACQHDWEEARLLLKEGGYRSFLVGLGRCDLAQAAERAAAHPILDLGLDDFLARLPGCQPTPPHLNIGRTELDLGTLVRGQDRYVTLTIENTGGRLLSGVACSVDCLWLGVSALHLNEKRFRATSGEQVQLQLYIRGNQLRAGLQPQAGEVAIKSNGGDRSILVRIRVLVTPFPDGVLKGVQTPRQLAEKAQTVPKETARLLENGSVARWYKCNGWTYPITGPVATGVAIVQQYFEALGVTKPTRVNLGTNTVTLQGAAGESAQGRVVLSTSEKRPIYAHARANQPWLSVGPTEYQGNQAVIPLSVAAIPACSGQTLRAELSVQANGKQCFTVPVSLQVRGNAGTELKQRKSTLAGFELPPLPDATLPPLPNQAAHESSSEVIPLAEARVDSSGGRSRRILSCICLLLSFLLLTVSAALAAWKLLNEYRESLPPSPTKASAAEIAPGEWVRVGEGGPRARSRIGQT